MKKSTLLLSLLVSINAFSATPAAEFDLAGVNITPLVKFLEERVVTLKKPVFIYNWSPNGKMSEADIQRFAPASSRTFWQMYGNSKGVDNMYGSGLYGAVDPVLTASYGGYDKESWLLVEMELPAGFKLLDVALFLTNPLTKGISEEAKKVAEAFDCPINGGEDKWFQSGGAATSPKCQQLVKKIYQEIIKIDGFAYSYGRTAFRECTEYEGYKAFVITDSKWMTPKLVRPFTSKTATNLEERIRIQTIFLKALGESPNMTKETLKPIGEYLAKNPTSNIKGSKTVCANDTCIITVNFCDAKNVCEYLSLPPLARPGGALITSREASKGTVFQTLLWPDLEGQPKSKTISAWIKENTYKCVSQ